MRGDQHGHDRKGAVGLSGCDYSGQGGVDTERAAIGRLRENLTVRITQECMTSIERTAKIGSGDVWVEDSGEERR